METKENLPLEEAYPFLTSKGLDYKIKEIKELKYLNSNRNSSARRGYFIIICEENKLLDEFINDFWPYGKKHPNKIKYFKKLYLESINGSKIHETNERGAKIKKQDKNNIPYQSVLMKNNKHDIKENIFPDNPLNVVHRVMEKINEVNQNQKNHKKDLIFKKEVHELSRDIEIFCTSKAEFIEFTLTLYKMIYETTRVENSNANTRGKPFYDYKLPSEFYKNGTPTRHFMDIVGTFRHHYAHLEPEYKVNIKKYLYEDVLFELLGSRDEPKSKEEFQKLQVEILKMFENAMKNLYQMVRKELNQAKN